MIGKEWMDYERRKYVARMREIERQSVGDKQEAAADFRQAVTEMPVVVVDRIRWLLIGTYGWAEAEAANRVLAGKRNNKRAQLFQMIGRLEWSCPTYYIGKIWKELPAAAQQALNNLIDQDIKEYQDDNPGWMKEYNLEVQ